MAKVQDIQLLLVRSGATSWDESGRLAGGGTDLPLCPTGLACVQERTTRLKGSSLGLVVTASDTASVETAKLIASATGAKRRIEEDLAEARLGLWEGLLVSQLEERFPTVYRQWREDPEGVLIPDGESIEETRERLIGEITHILSKSRGVGKGVALVLRPLAFMMVWTWLRGERLGENWLDAKDVPLMEWHCVPKLKLRSPSETNNDPLTPDSRAKAS
jgi:broad specificity phosphatase PhoE